MKGESAYQKTIALLCRDFLETVEHMSELSDENDLLDRITCRIIDEGDEDLFHTGNLGNHLAFYSGKLLSLYSRNPQNTALDTLFRRCESLKNMCTDLLKGSGPV